MDNSILKFLGRSASFGLHNNSAYIENHNRLILIDCGLTVYSAVKEKFDLSKYEKIDIIITHLHPDHAGSLGQLLVYLGYILHKKANVVCNCTNIITYLDTIGIDHELYTINPIPEVTFIKTTHVSQLDSYGFKMNINNHSLIYTGDTSTLEPFENYIPGTDELYVDVSKSGGVHLKIDDILNKLLSIQTLGTKVYLMHLDDENYISDIVNGLIDFAQIDS